MRVYGLVVSFLITTVIARSLGPDGFGNYSFFIVAVSSLATLSLFGAPTYLVKEFSRADDDRELFRKAIPFWDCLFSAGFVLALCLAIILPWLLLSGDDDQLFTTFTIASIAACCVTLIGLCVAALRGMKKTTTAQLPESVVRTSLLLAAVVVFGLIGMPADYRAYIALYAVSVAGAATFACFLVGRTGLVKVDRASRTEIVNRLSLVSILNCLKQTSPFAGISSVQAIGLLAETSLVSAMSSPQDLGVYRLAVAYSLIVTFPIQISILVAAPNIQTALSRSPASLERYAGLCALLATVCSAVGVVAIFLWGESLIETAVGAQYAAAAPVLLVMAVGHSVSAIFGPAGTIMSMTGSERLNLAIIVAWLILLVAIGCILIPRHGALGAAIGSGFSLLALKGACWIALYRRLGVRADAFALAGSRSRDRS
jgi:O-antigen/teichoic acid export membrane protein